MNKCKKGEVEPIKTVYMGKCMRKTADRQKKNEKANIHP
jgi:hypothetical protein